MANLNVNQKNIFELFSDKKADFLIPDYQRPYAWGKDECQTLWEDLISFAFPENNYSNFKTDDEYFLGPIVTFKNENSKLEVIDGQQRLTTLMLLLRGFYEKFSTMQVTNENDKSTCSKLASCIWKTDEFGNPDKSKLKIDSQVADDDTKEEFLNILKSGSAVGMKSRYAENYLFFASQIDNFISTNPTSFAYLPTRILNNCIILPIEADSQDTALRIFSTLNDRGLPLSDSDIFKSQFYKFYNSKNEKDKFIKEWKELEELCGKIFHPVRGTPMDELFMRYMYFERAKKGNTRSTTEALRAFYEGPDRKYELLRQDSTFRNLQSLANFWKEVASQNSEKFSDDVLRKLFILNYAPNGMWTYLVSVYFMKNKDKNGNLAEKKFSSFLSKITAFIFAYSITNPGISTLRLPIFKEMKNIVDGKDISFADNKFEEKNIRTLFENYYFGNGRPITKSILTWWAFQNKKQTIPDLSTVFEIEHIYAKRRYELTPLSNVKKLESLGNKSILEKRINIRASDYNFSDKIKYYKGIDNAGKKKAPTIVSEILELANTKKDFTENDIDKRQSEIIDSFVKSLRQNDLLK